MSISPAQKDRYPAEEINPRMKNILMYVFEEKFKKLKIRLPSKGSSITVNKSRHLPNYINNSWVWFGTSDPDLDQNKLEHPTCQKINF
jgi:hypothetical protein